MALPGWNVTEPLHIAKKIYDLVSAYQDAPSEIRSFSSHVSGFCLNLEALDELLADSTYAAYDVSARSFEPTLKRYNVCVAHCKEFLKQIQENPTAGQKGKWLFKNKDKAATLGKEIDSLNTSIAVLLTLDIHKRLRRGSQEFRTERGSGIQGSAEPSPISPADLLSLKYQFPEKEGLADGNAARYPPVPAVVNYLGGIETLTSTLPYGVDLTLSQPSSNQPKAGLLPQLSYGSFHPSSWTTLHSQKSVPRRDSQLLLYSCVVDPKMTMVNLKSAKISYPTAFKDTPSVKRIHQIEYLKDTAGRLRFLSITMTPGSTSRLHQTISLNPKTIPHSDHPIAYQTQNPFVVTFLEPHRLISEKQSGLANAASNTSSRTPSLVDTPRTVVSTDSGQDILDIGSPLLTPSLVKVRKESEWPTYEFDGKEEYEDFQASIMDKSLLVNVPVDFVYYKLRTAPRPYQEVERQYLRLWEDKGNQTIMFFANFSNRYVEYDIKNFLKPTKEPELNILTLLVNIAEIVPAPPMSPRKWSLSSKRNFISSYTLPVGTEETADRASKELINLESIIVTFSDSNGKLSS
ncbi:hypothetical protein MMC18_006789 [Xylographa bjoerkii]|nr:hypothetical protein [Xylographa bjoerkii]